MEPVGDIRLKKAAPDDKKGQKPMGVLTARSTNTFLTGRGRGLYRAVPPPLQMADTIKNAPRIPQTPTPRPRTVTPTPTSSLIGKPRSSTIPNRRKSVTFQIPSGAPSAQKMAAIFPNARKNKENEKPGTNHVTVQVKRNTKESTKTGSPVSKDEWYRIYQEHNQTGKAAEIHAEVN